jgi:hypothetical protein
VRVKAFHHRRRAVLVKRNANVADARYSAKIGRKDGVVDRVVGLWRSSLVCGLEVCALSRSFSLSPTQSKAMPAMSKIV